MRRLLCSAVLLWAAAAPVLAQQRLLPLAPQRLLPLAPQRLLPLAPQRLLPLADVRSGITFSGRDVQALQADAPANPAQLWLAQGRTLWTTRAGAAQRSCSDCHGDIAQMKGVAVNFPKLHAGTGRLFNLEDQVRHCSSERQQAAAPAFESDELLALTALLTQASQGLPLPPVDDPALLPHLRAGAALFEGRQGQLNLACTHCHDRNWGRRFHTDILSQGQANGYPLYRLEWQHLGSLERRLRSCHVGVRAEPPPYGDVTLRQLSLYLKWRGQGLPVEMPAVRK